MTIEPNDILNSILDSLNKIDYIKSEEIPNIDLYMDQVTTFMEEHLKNFKRYADDKILTKTMINNYTKNNLLPPPEKKKYSKEHMILLIYIYYYKGILSINDIQSLLEPLTKQYFHKEDSLSMQTIYEKIFGLEAAQIDKLKEDFSEKYKTASSLFSEAQIEDREFLEIFSFICLLSFDVYIKKQVIEKLIDQFQKNETDKNKHKK